MTKWLKDNGIVIAVYLLIAGCAYAYARSDINRNTEDLKEVKSEVKTVQQKQQELNQQIVGKLERIDERTKLLVEMQQRADQQNASASARGK